MRYAAAQLGLFFLFSLLSLLSFLSDLSAAVTAPQYVEYLMAWVQSCLDNDKLFPARVDVPFPKHFESVVKQIFKRLFRVYAHMYYSHFQKIVALGESLGLPK